MSAAIEEVIWRRTIDRRRFRKHRPLVFSETKQLFASAEESSSFLVVETDFASNTLGQFVVVIKERLLFPLSFSSSRGENWCPVLLEVIAVVDSFFFFFALIRS